MVGLYRVLVGVLVVVKGTGACGATLQVLRRLVVRQCDLFEVVIELIDYHETERVERERTTKALAVA